MQDDNQNVSQTKKVKQLKADEWIPAMLHLIQDGKELKIKPQGNSMYPFLKDSRDYVILKLPDREFRRGDIVLYRRDNGLHVVHRIYRIKKDACYMVGDNQKDIEGPLRRDQLLAITVKIIRKGKIINCRENLWYRFLSFLWLLIIPFRFYVIRAWQKFYTLTHR